MALTLTNDEIRDLFDSLGVAHKSGYRTSDEFLAYLLIESSFYLQKEKEHYEKASLGGISHLKKKTFLKISNKCREKSRRSKHLHAKIVQYRRRVMSSKFNDLQKRYK